MSLPQVAPRLTNLGLSVDLCAWYPWLHFTDKPGGYYLGMDSCAAFYIGGNVSCKLPLDFDRIGALLTETVRDPKERPRSRHDGALFDTNLARTFPANLGMNTRTKETKRGRSV